jgi:hypothetical protein
LVCVLDPAVLCQPCISATFDAGLMKERSLTFRLNWARSRLVSELALAAGRSASYCPGNLDVMRWVSANLWKQRDSLDQWVHDLAYLVLLLWPAQLDD